MPNSIGYDESFIYDQKNDRVEKVEPRDYNVYWAVEVTAESEEEAVQIAYGIMADPEMIATYFRVEDAKTGESIIKDYEEILFPERFKE